MKSYSRHWPCLFPQHVPGKKHPRKIELAERWYEYPRYLFVNESADILRLCGQTLDQLAVE